MPMRPSLTLPKGLEPVRSRPQRIIAAIRGNAKEGKTAFALDFPEPVVIFNFDYGYESAAKFILHKDPGKKLYHFDMPITDDMSVTEMAATLKKFQAKYVECLNYCDALGGTVVVDTASDLWRIVQEAVLGPIKEKLAPGKYMSQFEYGKANIVMAGLLRRPYHLENVNAVFIHRNKPIYSGGEATGRFEGQWFNDTPAIVEYVFEVFEDMADKKIKTRIEVCRPDCTLRGTVLVNPTHSLIWSMVGPEEEAEAPTAIGIDGVMGVGLGDDGELVPTQNLDF
jgi:hypothetical protein